MIASIIFHPFLLIGIASIFFIVLGATILQSRTQPTSSRMGLAIAIGGFMAIILFNIFILDGWLGILAFKFYYLTFALCFAAIATMLVRWLAKSRNVSIAAGLVILTLLVAPYFISTPSSRILRAVLIDVEAGTTAAEVEALVINAYQDTGYEMPKITKSNDRIFVSLLSQEVGNAAGAIFLLKDGVVVKDIFTPD